MTNYPTYKLSEIARSTKGKKPKSVSKEKADGFEIPYVDIKAFEKGIVDNYTDGENCTFCKPDDVLIVWDGARCGFVGRGVEGAIGSTLAKISSDKYTNDFLFYFLQSKYKVLNSNPRGVGIPHIEPNLLWNFEIPDVDKTTQRLIVTRIESLFAELDKGVEHLCTAQQQIKTYRQAVLNETMNATKFVPVGEVILEMGQGWSPKCHNEPSTNENEWGVIKTTAIQSCCFLEEENKKLPENLEPRFKHELKAGDILITRAGPKVRVGVCCLIKKTRPRLINCDKAYRIVLNRDLIDAQYFEYAINSPTCIKKLDELKTGISDSGVNLTQSRFYDLQIPLPPLSEQQRIVAEIEGRLSQASTSSAYIENALQQAEALRQSILKKAFCGELVVSTSSTTSKGG